MIPILSPAASVMRHSIALGRALLDGDRHLLGVATRELAELGVRVEVDFDLWNTCRGCIGAADGVDSRVSAKTRGAAATPLPAPLSSIGPAEGSRPRSDLGNTP